MVNTGKFTSPMDAMGIRVVFLFRFGTFAPASVRSQRMALHEVSLDFFAKKVRRHHKATTRHQKTTRLNFLETCYLGTSCVYLRHQVISHCRHIVREWTRGVIHHLWNAQYVTSMKPKGMRMEPEGRPATHGAGGPIWWKNYRQKCRGSSTQWGNARLSHWVFRTLL